MRYVIKYTDGSYNQGAGFTCPLEEATIYGSLKEAENVADDLIDVEVIKPYEERQWVTPLSREALIEMIQAATRKLTVCVPSQDFYRRADDWTDETIKYVDPDALIELLKETP